MPARELLSDRTCEQAIAIAERWGVDRAIMWRVAQVATRFKQETGRDVRIISGWRSAAEQKKLKDQGRPTADPRLSTHLSCPATGVDVNVGFGVTNVMKATWGRLVTEAGLRWGGGSRPDPRTGIPSDWNHVDAGPRRS